MLTGTHATGRFFVSDCGQTWPALVAIVLVLGAAGFLMTYYAIQARDASETRAAAYQKTLFDKKQIKGGATGDSVVGEDIISDDGVIGNPKKYPASGACYPFPSVLWE